MDEQRAPRRVVFRVLMWCLALLVVAVVALGVSLAWDGARLLGAKRDLTTHAVAAQDALAARDAQALAREASALEEAAAEFASATDGPQWWVAQRLPWVASQAVPVVAVGDAIRLVANEALSPLAAMGDLSVLEAPPIEDGRIDPYVLEEYRPVLAQASAALVEATDQLASISLDGAVDQVRGAYDDLEVRLAEVRDLVGDAHATAELLPTMLGGDGARTYLVMVQNNAEPRATGGLPGAILELAVDDGEIDIVRAVATRDLYVPEGLGDVLTDDEVAAFSDLMASFPQDVNFTPEFPRAAELLGEYWQHWYGDRPDGVAALDPVALGWMLRGAEPVTVQGIRITADNVASLMLHDVYAQIDGDVEQDLFFAEAAGALAPALLEGGTSLLDGLERAIDKGRFLLWSADDGEQALLEDLPISGAFLEHDDALGVFVNDASGSKIGYLVDVQTTITDHLCTDGTIAGETVQVEVSHTYTGDVGDLARAVGIGGGYVPAGEFHANVLFYPAAGTSIVGYARDGVDDAWELWPHDAREMSAIRVELAPGESTVLTFEVEAAEGTAPPDAVQTPGPAEVQIARTTDAAADC
ncbi:DUF4012 domain-containing protein [Demequina maris]|uniref:DUF4012 domain-containing protein n=1 Tax=Demequina maris TaxID=1638982 RepID=UPI0007804629|nr:DUF4012 domain-containing protein [Demequina maris]